MFRYQYPLPISVSVLHVLTAPVRFNFKEYLLSYQQVEYQDSIKCYMYIFSG